MRPPRRGEIWIAGTGPAPQTVLVISSTVYNEITSEPTVLVERATDEGFCVDLGQDQWAVMGLVTFVAKTSLTDYQRKVDIQTLTNANSMLFKILATPER